MHRPSNETIVMLRSNYLVFSHSKHCLFAQENFLTKNHFSRLLYRLLSDEAMERNIPVLILCNKQDQATAKGANVIKILLQNEINLLRITKSNQLDATDESSTNAFLGKNEKDFEFHHLNCKVEFAESTLFNKNADNPVDLKQIQAWLQKIA